MYANKVLAMVTRSARPAGVAVTVLLLLMVLAACGSQSTPPGGHSVSGSYDGRAGYLLVHWPEGLRIMIWDDLPHGAHHHGSSSSSGDPVFHMDGGAQGSNGQGYSYILESAGGVEGSFSIDDIPYNLDRGKLFLIRTGGGETRVEQLDVDLSGLAASNAGVEAFGQHLPQIIAFAAASEPPPIPTSTGAVAQPPTAESAPPDRETTSNIPAVDKTVAVILSNDYGARRELVRLSTAGCTTVMGLGGPPKCEPGQADGTAVEYFPVRLLQGEGWAFSAGNSHEALDFEATRLYSFYSQNPVSRYEPGSLGREFAVIFETVEQEGYRVFVIFHLNREGQIVQLDYSPCAIDAEGNILEEQFA